MPFPAICTACEKRNLNVVEPVEIRPNSVLSLSLTSLAIAAVEISGNRPSSREFPACPG
jgi:hypothetical protein